VFLFYSLPHEGSVGFLRAEPAQDKGCVIPGKGILVKEIIMAAPSVRVKFFRSLDDSGTERIEVNIADEFHEVDILVTDDRGIAVLEKVTSPVVSFVVTCGMTGQETAHESGQPGWSAAQKKMEMVGDQRKAIDRCRHLFRQKTDPFKETFTIIVVLEDRPAFYSTGHDMMEDSFSVEACLPGHYPISFFPLYQWGSTLSS